MNRSDLPWELPAHMDANGQPIDLEWFAAQDARMRALARRLVRDAHLAEDVAQDAWAASVRGLSVNTTLGAWLAGVTRKLSLKALRSRERRVRRELGSTPPDTPPTTDALVAREAARRAVADAVLGLPEGMRTVIVWRFFDGMSPGAIARRLGEPVETIRTRIKRGLERLRRELDDRHGGDGRAWCAALAPLAFAKTSAAGIGAVLTGVAAMHVSVKIGLFSAALVAVALTLRPLFRDTDPTEREPEVSASSTPDGGVNAVVLDDPTREPAAVQLAGTEASGAPALADALGSAPVPTVDLTLRARWSDGAPAAGVGLHFIADLTRSRTLIPASYVLRSDGSVVIPDVPYGMALYEFDRGAGGSLDVDAEHHEFDVEIPRGQDIRGVVVDATGAPVAGADVRTQGLGMQPAGFTLAQSGDDGSFVIRHVSQTRPIGATKAGYAPSPFVLVQGASSGERTLKLALREGGSAIDVVVVGPDSRPIEDALVALVPPGGSMVQADDGSIAFESTISAKRTDSTGRARFVGVFEGEHDVTVAAPPLAEFTDRWTLVRGANPERTVALDAGVRIHGTVTDSAGNPVVRAYVQRLASSWFAGGSAYTDEHGNYAMTGVPRSPQTMRASLTNVGSMELAVHPPAEGTEHRVNFTLVAAATLLGIVVDDQGAPLVGWIVRPVLDPAVIGFDIGQGYTTENGRFFIGSASPLSQRLEVSPSDASANLPTYSHGPFVPDGQEVRVVVPSARLARMEIRGRVLGPGARAVVGVEAFASRSELDGGGFAMSHADENGELRIGPLTPGRYTLTIRAPGFAPFVASHTFTASAETWDLGTIELGAGGQILAHVECLPNESAKPWITLLRAADGSLVGSYVGSSDGEVRSELLPPGRYRVCVGSWERAWSSTVVEVTANSTAELRIAARRGTRVVVQTAVPANVKSVELFIEDMTGTRIAAGDAIRDYTGKTAVQLFALAPGTYRVTARGPDDREVSTTFVVSSESTTVDLTLR